MPDEDDFNEDELLDAELPPGDLAIRVDRAGELHVTFDGAPIPVSSIDIDEVSIERLSEIPRTVRDQ